MGKGSFGEPLQKRVIHVRCGEDETEPVVVIVNRDGEEVAHIGVIGSIHDAEELVGDRLAVCATALDGKKDPEEWVKAVRALVEAAYDIETCFADGDLDNKSLHRACFKVLAALASLREAEGE